MLSVKDEIKVELEVRAMGSEMLLVLEKVTSTTNNTQLKLLEKYINNKDEDHG